MINLFRSLIAALVISSPTFADEFKIGSCPVFEKIVAPATIDPVLSKIVSPGEHLHRECPSWKFIPSKLIDQIYHAPECAKQNKPIDIYLYGETHTDQIDKEIGSLIDTAAWINGTVYALLEGYASSKNQGTWVGLNPKGGVDDYTHFLVFKAFSRNLKEFSELAKSANRDEATFGNIMRDKYVGPVKVMTRQILSIICDNSSFWKTLERPLELEVEEELAKKIDLLVKEQYCGPNTPLMDDIVSFINDNLSDVKETVTDLIQKSFEDHILSSPDFAGISLEDLRAHAIQELRELTWIKSMNAIACDASSNHQPIWFQIGRKHQDSLACAIRSLYGDQVNVIKVDKSKIKLGFKTSIRMAFITEELPRILDEIRPAISKLNLSAPFNFKITHKHGKLVRVEIEDLVNTSDKEFQETWNDVLTLVKAALKKHSHNYSLVDLPIDSGEVQVMLFQFNMAMPQDLVE